jgi:four helix bundle protein
MLRVYDLLLHITRQLRPVIDAIEKRDGDLARQMRRALPSSLLNAAEGTLARGRNGSLRFCSAMTSLRETLACIDGAVALGYIADVDAALRDDIDHALAILFKLSR